MVSWARKRQFTYGGGFLALIIFFAVGGYYIFFYQAPTCFDGVKNADEQGIDCGGSCKAVCSFSAAPLTVHWARVFKVSTGNYNAVANVENPNEAIVAFGVPYTMKFYDDQNILVYERQGMTDIPAKKTFPIFESGIDTGSRIPVQVFFSFTGTPFWQRSQGTDGASPLTVSNTVLSDASTTPRIDASVQNTTLNSYLRVPVVAVIYDPKGNAIAASQTVIGELDPQAAAPLFFTWPQAFSDTAARIEITPKLPVM